MAFDLFDGTKIDAVNESVDLVVISHVLEHVAEPRALLAECARVGREVVIEIPMELHLRMPPYAWNDVGHINVFNRRSIRYLLMSCGLSILGERIYTPSREAEMLDAGVRGLARWAIKAMALPIGGQALLTYHYAALSRPEPA